MGGSFFGPPTTGGNITAGQDTDLDNNEVLVTALDAVDGWLFVMEKAGHVGGWWVAENSVLTEVKANAAYTTVKDNAGTFNVYYEGGVVKVQNKVGNNKNVAVGFIQV